MAVPVSPARVAEWLHGLMSDDFTSVRALAEAIKSGNGGQGPSHQTLQNLLDPSRATRLEEHTITAIAAFFRQDPVVVEQTLGITLSPSAHVLLQVTRIQGLREMAILAAQLPGYRFREIHDMVRQAVENGASGEPSPAKSRPSAPVRSDSD